MNRSSLAKACGVVPSTIGDYISGKIEVTRKNLLRILTGIPEKNDRELLLRAYLEDQIPEEYRTVFGIERKNAGKAQAHGEALAAAEIIQGMNGAMQKKLITLLRRIRDDAELRDLLSRTIAYIDGEETRVSRNKSFGHGRRKPNRQAGR